MGSASFSFSILEVIFNAEKFFIMKRTALILAASCFLFSCNNKQQQAKEANAPANEAFNKMLDQYWEERMQLFPLEATANGDNRYNDRMTITIAQSFRDSLKRFYE